MRAAVEKGDHERGLVVKRRNLGADSRGAENSEVGVLGHREGVSNGRGGWPECGSKAKGGCQTRLSMGCIC